MEKKRWRNIREKNNYQKNMSGKCKGQKKIRRKKKERGDMILEDLIRKNLAEQKGGE